MTIQVFVQKVLRRLRSYWNEMINHTISVSRKDKKRLVEIERQYPEILSTSETLKRIVDHHLSVCRFGDGEFDVMDALDPDDTYQKPSKELSRRLKEVLEYRSDDKILICIPPFNSPTNNIKNFYKRLTFWEAYWLKRFDRLSHYFIYSCYGNSFISRDTVFYENRLDEIKKIWEGRKIVFVYGRGGRFKTDSPLFDNILSFESVTVPPTSAFDDYANILHACLNYSKEFLFIISAGQTATVLAFDLAKRGYQALDFGHISNCYNQYLGISPRPEVIPLIGNQNG